MIQQRQQKVNPLYCDGFSGANLDVQGDENALFPSIVLRPNSFKKNPNDEFIFDDDYADDELHLSMVYSAGETKPYTLYFFEGTESKWFFKEKKFVFEVLFRPLVSESLIPPQSSRLMKRVVLVNNNGPLFEMTDGRLYLFDIKSEKLIPFFIPIISQIKCIGSGIMSNVIMVQTIDGKIIKKHFEKEPQELTLSDPSPVKLFSCYCRDLQLIVLENNKLFGFKSGSTSDAHYGFTNYPLDQPFEVQTPFESGIKKISSGYGNCIVLLENGQVFTKGLNNYHQCIKMDISTIEDFYQVTTIESPVLDIECGSICAALRTRNHFVFFGTLSSVFEKTGYYHSIEFQDQQMSIGPWHGLIYRHKYLHVGKSEIYFMKNLESVSRSNNNNISPFSDTVLFFDNEM